MLVGRFILSVLQALSAILLWQACSLYCHNHVPGMIGVIQFMGIVCVISGDLVSVYTSLGYHHAVSDVQFHPLDHIIAFCSFGDSHPVLVFHYDPKGLF